MFSQGSTPYMELSPVQVVCDRFNNHYQIHQSHRRIIMFRLRSQWFEITFDSQSHRRNVPTNCSSRCNVVGNKMTTKNSFYFFFKKKNLKYYRRSDAAERPTMSELATLLDRLVTSSSTQSNDND